MELLSLKENTLFALETAISTGTIIACFSKDKNAFYLHTESLLKWLMIHNHFPQQWLQDFKKLKIKSLDELASSTPQTFTLDQLKVFLQKYHPGNEDINYHLNTGVYHVYLYMRKGMICTYLENKQPIQVDNPTHIIRYLNLECLLPFSTDPYQIAKNLLDGITINANQCNGFIFLDSTREEYAQGLQRILSLRAEGSSENHYQLNYQDLRFVTDEVKQGLKKHLPLTSGKSRQKIATESGVISGKVRREDTQEHWLSIKPQVLEIAKSCNKAYINKIAEIAKKRGLTSKSTRTLSRLIAADPCFAPYLKKNSLLID